MNTLRLYQRHERKTKVFVCWFWMKFSDNSRFSHTIIDWMRGEGELENLFSSWGKWWWLEHIRVIDFWICFFEVSWSLTISTDFQILILNQWTHKKLFNRLLQLYSQDVFLSYSHYFQSSNLKSAILQPSSFPSTIPPQSILRFS